MINVIFKDEKDMVMSTVAKSVRVVGKRVFVSLGRPVLYFDVETEVKAVQIAKDTCAQQYIDLLSVKNLQMSAWSILRDDAARILFDYYTEHKDELKSVVDLEGRRSCSMDRLAEGDFRRFGNFRTPDSWAIFLDKTFGVDVFLKLIKNTMWMQYTSTSMGQCEVDDE